MGGLLLSRQVVGENDLPRGQNSKYGTLARRSSVMAAP
jgi:hypothetical protein